MTRGNVVKKEQKETNPSERDFRLVTCVYYNHDILDLFYKETKFRMSDKCQMAATQSGADWCLKREIESMMTGQ